VREDLHYVMDRDLWLRLRVKTVFHRQRLVVGADRHHGDRKTVSQGYEDEKLSFGHERLEKVWPSAYRKVANLLFRQAGAIQVPLLHARIQPAFDLRFDSTLPFLKRQLFERRLEMPAD
jgi:hypothetical protein